MTKDPREMSDSEFMAHFAEASETPSQPRLKPPQIQEFDEHGRGYWYLEGLDEKGGSTVSLKEKIDNENRQIATKAKANLISSQCFDGSHRPVLDFDIPAHYVPSSTPGHGHLYIDKNMSWETYERLLIALADAGILERGYVHAALCRKATFVRPEGVFKPGTKSE